MKVYDFYTQKAKDDTDRICALEAVIFANNLLMLEVQKKLTKEEMASLCGISVKTYSDIQNKRVMPLYHTMNRIAKGLSMDVHTLSTKILF